MRRRFFLLGVLLLGITQLSCSAPHLFYPQKDIEISELNKPSLEKKVLIASRRSDFKNSIVSSIREAFKDKPVYMKFIGLDQLRKEDATDYSAVVLINTCMAWSMDRNVNGFVKRHGDQSNMIVLTTSGDGNWMPKMKERNFDAISSASEEHKIEEVAEKIINKVNSLLQDV